MGDALCTRCSGKIHRSGARQNHTLFGLRKAAYNKKLFADNLDRLMGIIQKNIERSCPLSPWFIVYDAGLSPYWYNFQTRHQVRADPNDLMNPPNVEGEGTEGLGDIHTVIPNVVTLRDTHAARYAAQGACFDVPPPVHVKYVSPIA